MTSRPGTRLFACVLLFTAATTASRAYPISPQPLWALVEQSDLIVYAEVGGVTRPDTSDPEPSLDGDYEPPPPAVAYLRPLDTWKGPHMEELEVDFEPDYICPAPARYIEGENVLAFLAWYEGRLVTVGLSYGTLYPADGEVEDFREMVGRAVDLQAKPPVPEESKVEWAVDAASRVGTRWHGLYELHARGDAMHSYYDQEERDLAGVPLSAEQIGRIARAFAAAPAADVTLPMVLAVTQGYEDAELDLAVVAAIETVLERDYLPYWFEDTLALALLRFGDPSPDARLERICGDSAVCSAAPKKARRLWNKARAELGIPTAEPLEPSEPRVRGVGPNTPS